MDIEHRQAMRLAPAIGFSHFPYASIAWTGSMGLISASATAVAPLSWHFANRVQSYNKRYILQNKSNVYFVFVLRLLLFIGLEIRFMEFC